MIRRVLIFTIVLNISILARAQQTYISPVNFPVVLAGNFGEIRDNHFHSGIDIKALKGVGSPINAAMGGYISRIGVAPSGYGNFIVLSHSNGSSTLYAHLDRLENKIQDYLESEQVKRRSYAVDIYPAKELFPVNSGDVVAFMGNSGSSNGAHLHFEIRDNSNRPVNPLGLMDIKVLDDIVPRLYKILLYSCDTVAGIPVFRNSQTLICQDGVVPNQALRIASPSYIAYEVIDFKNGAANTMGISKLTQKVDGYTNFSIYIDKISFATTKNIDALVQYDKNLQTKNHVLRAYLPPNTSLQIYQSVYDQGLIRPELLSENSVLATTFTDDSGNTSAFTIKLQKVNETRQSVQLPENLKAVLCDKFFAITFDNATVSIPAKALYESAVLPFFKRDSVYIIGDPGTPLKDKITISINTALQSNIGSKSALYRMSDTGKLNYIGGAYNDGKLVVTLTSLGKFIISCDSIAPLISPVAKVNNSPNKSYLKFNISDEMSGISKYYIFIDDIWCIPIYDPKSQSLQCKIKTGSMPSLHKVSVQVIDREGNKAIKQFQYTW